MEFDNRIRFHIIIIYEIILRILLILAVIATFVTTIFFFSNYVEILWRQIILKVFTKVDTKTSFCWKSGRWRITLRTARRKPLSVKYVPRHLKMFSTTGCAIFRWWVWHGSRATWCRLSRKMTRYSIERKNKTDWTTRSEIIFVNKWQSLKVFSCPSLRIIPK